MDRVPVQSSNLASVGYNEDGQTLEVEFLGKSGKPNSVYQYDGVPHEKWVGLLQSPSKGRYFAAEIKSHYRATKVA